MKIIKFYGTERKYLLDDGRVIHISEYNKEVEKLKVEQVSVNTISTIITKKTKKKKRKKWL